MVFGKRPYSRALGPFVLARSARIFNLALGSGAAAEEFWDRELVRPEAASALGLHGLQAHIADQVHPASPSIYLHIYIYIVSLCHLWYIRSCRIFIISSSTALLWVPYLGALKAT